MDLFYGLGKLIYKTRWFVIVLWLGIIGLCVPFLPHITDPFKAIGFKDPNSSSAKANQLLNDKLGYSYNRFIIMYTSDERFITHPERLAEIKRSLEGLKKFPLKHQIIYPNKDNQQISKEGYAAYAVVLFKSKQEIDPKLLAEFKKLIKQPPSLVMNLGGEPIFLDDTKVQTQRDLYKAEYIGTPVAIITMLVVFGSVVAASLPIILGGVSALLILGALFCLGHFFILSVFTLNIALLLGLCLSLDYALLIISRFKDELAKGESVKEALAITQATAGKAVFFSGLAVFISLSGLLFFKINVLFSVGMGGLAAVLVSVAIAVILLPAILGILNHRINWLPILLFKKQDIRKSYWHWLVTRIVKRPLIYFIACLLFLLALGYPLLHTKVGISDFRILPNTLQSRIVFDIFQDQYGENKLDPIFVVVQTPQKKILTNKNIDALYEYVDKIKKDPRVEEVTSIVSTKPRMSKAEYKLMYVSMPDRMPSELKKYLEITTKDNLTVMTVISKYLGNAKETTDLIEHLRTLKPGGNLKIQLTGGAVNTLEVKQSITETFFKAFLWIVIFTYLILLFFLRSLFLPLKAIITTILSLCASYGVLVFVFQMGYFHEILNFDPQGMLDFSLLIIIFCALFGVSMDYEVFLLTRIKEYYEQSKDNVKSIIFGIERSSKIITSAAIIVIMLCFSFMAADIIIVKAFGMGIAVAVFVDAFIIRTILVPATMTMLGKWNWYLPRWLGRILPNISFDPEHYHPVRGKVPPKK